MRYAEIIEAAHRLRIESDDNEKRKRAQERIAAADRKRADAARRYRNDVDRAHDARQKAMAKLRSLSVAEAVLVQDRPVASPRPLIERPSGLALRDHTGSILGWIEAVGRLLQAKDRNGSVVGWYDPRTDQTRDRVGSIVGSGDLLAALIFTAHSRR